MKRIDEEQSRAEGRSIADDMEDLRALSQDVTTAIERLAERLPPIDGSAPMSDTELARKTLAIIAARRARDAAFGARWFSDPAWDILLAVFADELAQRRSSVSAVCIASSCAATTALRWIKGMTQEGLLVRQEDPTDPRRTFLSLSDRANAAMRAYLDAHRSTPPNGF